MPVSRRLFFLFCAACIVSVSPFLSPCEARRKARTEAEILQASVKRETAIGKKVADEIAEHMSIIEDPFLTARVRGVFNKLTPWTTRPLPYNVHIVKEKSPNAFCIPGGNIYVTSGLIDFVRSDAELAFVIAHELAHANGRHVLVQMERNQKLGLAALAVAIASRGAGAAIMLSNVAAIAVANAYSRDLEQEADMNGAEFAQKAGYDLVAGVTVMESLAEEELKTPWIDPGVYRDHPKISERIGYISDLVQKKGYALKRKYVLKLLVPKIEEKSGRLNFLIDDTFIASLPDDASSRAYFEKARSGVERFFQMETPAYDIRLAGEGRSKGVYSGVVPLFPPSSSFGADELAAIRERLLVALNEARKKHPMANYA